MQTQLLVLIWHPWMVISWFMAQRYGPWTQFPRLPRLPPNCPQHMMTDVSWFSRWLALNHRCRYMKGKLGQPAKQHRYVGTTSDKVGETTTRLTCCSIRSSNGSKARNRLQKNEWIQNWIGGFQVAVYWKETECYRFEIPFMGVLLSSSWDA